MDGPGRIEYMASSLFITSSLEKGLITASNVGAPHNCLQYSSTLVRRYVMKTNFFQNVQLLRPLLYVL